MQDFNSEEYNFFSKLNSEPVLHNGIILIPIKKAKQTFEKLIDKNFRILGYDAFRLNQDNTIQPFLDYSMDYSNSKIEYDSISKDLDKIPDEITHIEIVINNCR